jgi:hypothetical protein
MAGFGYVCALVLAAVFVRAAAAKLVRPELAAAGFAALGLPAGPALARVVPAAELVVAAALVGWPPVGGAASLVMLAGFTVVIARAVRAGVSTGCTCFGAVSAEPVGPTDLIRNVLLAGLAVAAMAAAEPVVPTPLAATAAAVTVGAGLGVLGLSRRGGRLGGRARPRGR